LNRKDYVITPGLIGVYPLLPRTPSREELFVIARNEVTRQSSTAHAKLDCFATLAMTHPCLKGINTGLIGGPFPELTKYRKIRRWIAALPSVAFGSRE